MSNGARDGLRGVLPISERTRKGLHMAAGTLALLLPHVRWWQAAVVTAATVVVNAYVFRRITRGRDRREPEPNDDTAAIVLYPVSILLLMLLFPSRPDIVAAAWGVLAFGGGVAGLIGTRPSTRRWPWNRRASIERSLAIAVAGGAAGAFLAWWCRPALMPPPYLWFTLAAPAAAALVAAAVATVPIRLDDNLSISMSAAALLWALSLVNQELAIAALAAMPSTLLVAIPANAAIAAVGFAARTVSISGAIVGALIGTTIYASAGWQGWLLLLAAFLCAAVTSRLGWKRKNLLGIAEERGGRRGAGNAIANTGVAAVASILAAVSYAHAAGAVAFAAALTAGASDTIASEIGKAWGRRTWSIVPFVQVAPGTPGAMSLEGTLAGTIGAAGLGALAVLLGVVPSTALAAIVAAAVIGSLVESLLAASFEERGVLDNNALNLLNTACAAYVAVKLTPIAP